MNRFMESSNRSSTALPMASGPPGLYIFVSAGLATFNQTQARAARLARIAEFAYDRRDRVTMERAGRELASLPLEQAQNAGLYYLAIVAKWQGRTNETRAMLEAVRGPYQARAIQTLGTIHYQAGQFDEAVRFYAEAMRAGHKRDALTIFNAQGQLSAIKSAHGDHEQALDDLLSLWPIARFVARQHPHIWPVLHNELAFELLQLGRADEARQAAAVAVASPLAENYPEWHETAREIAETQRTAIIVAVPARASEQKTDHKVSMIRYQFVRPRARQKVIRPTIGRLPLICSIIERVATVAPIHAPPFTK